MSRIDCRACGAEIRQAAVDLGSTPLWYGVQTESARELLGEAQLPAQLLECEVCGLIQQPIFPELESALNLVYQNEFSNASTPVSNQGWGKRRADGFWQSISLDQIPARVLEIGCGSGYLLWEFLQRGANQVVGVEPSSVPLYSGLASLPSTQVKIVRDFFRADGILAEFQPFDLVYSLAVVEHVKNLREHIRDVHRILTVGGTFLCVAPNCNVSLRIGDVGMFMHEHLNYFTTHSLARLVEQNGFQVVEVKQDKAAIFLKASKIAQGSPLPVSQAAPALADYALRLRLALRLYSQIVERAGNAPVGLFGACNGAANLLAWAHRPATAFLFDSDASKWGRRVSGIPWEVYPPDQILHRGIREIVVVPFPYQQEIREDLQTRFPNVNPHLLYPYD